MQFSETIASTARYGECAAKLMDGWDILTERSEADYQGSCNVFAKHAEREEFAHIFWSYGSCSGCDGWEAKGSTDEEIVEEMRREGAWFSDLDAFLAYVDQFKPPWPFDRDRSIGDDVRSALMR